MNKELLSVANKTRFEEFVTKLLKELIEWKTDNSMVKEGSIKEKDIVFESVPANGEEYDKVFNHLLEKIKANTNFSSTRFMGFPDSGNSLAGLLGGIAEVFLQQNLINDHICSPYATQIEIQVLNWLREIVGYKPIEAITDASDIGGAVTTGGVMSNTYALMAAHKKYPHKKIIILPDNIGHYSLSYAADWLNLDAEVVYCKTKDFKLETKSLKGLLRKYQGNILFVAAYACDSMTSTCDDLEKIASIIDDTQDEIWLHCDACHGFVLGFSEVYKEKIRALKRFNSCTMDPHKVLWLPYTMSVLLMKEPVDFRYLVRENALIMDGALALGKTTPFVGSKAFDSLKLWLVIKCIGVKRIGEMVEERINYANKFKKMVESSESLVLQNNEVIFSVIFNYTKPNMTVAESNLINRKIFDRMTQEGLFYFHGFDITLCDKQEKTFVLRYNSGNLNITETEMLEAVQYIERLGEVEYASNR